MRGARLGNDGMRKRVKAMLFFMNVKEVSQSNKGRIHIEKHDLMREVRINGGKIVFDEKGYRKYLEKETTANKKPHVTQYRRRRFPKKSIPDPTPMKKNHDQKMNQRHEDSNRLDGRGYSHQECHRSHHQEHARRSPFYDQERHYDNRSNLDRKYTHNDGCDRKYFHDRYDKYYSHDDRYDRKRKPSHDRHDRYYSHDDRYDRKYDDRYDRKYKDGYDGKYNDRYDGKHNDRYDGKYDERYDGKYDDRYDGKYDDKYDRKDSYDDRYYRDRDGKCSHRKYSDDRYNRNYHNDRYDYDDYDRHPKRHCENHRY